MTTLAEIRMNGDHDHVLRPRAVKPMNPEVLRTMSQEDYLKPNGYTSENGGTTGHTRLELPEMPLFIFPDHHVVVPPRLSRQMPLLPCNQSPMRESSSGHSNGAVYFLQSSTHHEYRTSTRRASTGISMASTYYFGLA
jgi:hypothetical protein